MGCVRVGHEGTRSVACCHTADLFDYMTHQCGNKFMAEAVSVQTGFDFMKSMVHSDFEKFFNNGKTMWRATVGPHDALILPCGMFTVDATFGADVFGHKVSVALKTKLSAADLLALVDEATRRGAARDAEHMLLTIRYCGLEHEIEELRKATTEAAARKRSKRSGAEAQDDAAGAHARQPDAAAVPGTTTADGGGAGEGGGVGNGGDGGNGTGDAGNVADGHIADVHAGIADGNVANGAAVVAANGGVGDAATEG